MEELKERLTKLEETVSLFIAKVEGVATRSDENFMKMEDRLGKMENRLDKIDNRLDKIDNKLNVLTDETSTNFNEVGNRLGSIEAEIIKIGVATRYEQHHEDQKRFNLSS